MRVVWRSAILSRSGKHAKAEPCSSGRKCGMQCVFGATGNHTKVARLLWTGHYDNDYYYYYYYYYSAA